MALRLPDGFFPSFTLIEEMKNMQVVGSYYHVKDRSGTHLMVRCGKKEDLEKEYDLPLITNGLIVPRDSQITGDKMAIVFEYPTNGHNLEDKINKSTGPIQEDTIKRWVFDILMCLKELNDNRYFHNNLCLQTALVVNLVGEEHIKLTGVRTYIRLKPEVSSFRSKENPLNLCTPPEQLNGEARFRSSDIWSLGVMIYYMMTKRYPFTTVINDVHEKLTEYSKTSSLLKIPTGYSKDLTSLLQSCLTFDYKIRPNAHKLLDGDLFKEYLTTRPFLTCAVIRSNECNEMVRIYSNGSPNIAITGREIYRYGIFNWLEGDNAQILWSFNERSDICFSEVKIGDIKVCTATSIDDYVLPLFKGVKVKRGPDWLDDIHGNNDEFGAGTVLQVVQGSDSACNRVKVIWPTSNRIVEYYYGNICGVQKYEIFPAYCPILPHMKVRNLLATPKFEGKILRVEDNGDEAYVQIGKDKKILSYGKDNKFDFIIDDSYCEDFGLDSVQEYLNSLGVSKYDDQSDSDRPKINENIKNHYRDSLRGESHDQLQEGMFFIVPPNIKKCTYGIIDKIIENKINARAVLEQNDIIPIPTEIVISGELKQCSFGNNRYPPLIIGDKVVTNDKKEEYKVAAIYSTPKIDVKFRQTNWHYVVCVGGLSGDRMAVYRFDEVSKIGK